MHGHTNIKFALFPSTPPMAGQLPAHPSCDLVRVLIPSDITNTSDITKYLLAIIQCLAAKLLNH